MNTTTAATIVKTHKTTGEQVEMDLRPALGFMGVYESHRHNGVRVNLPLEQRDHPLQRWIDDAGVAQPVKPETAVRTLRIPVPATA